VPVPLPATRPGSETPSAPAVDRYETGPHACERSHKSP
jgi:hypothetical protein